MSEILRLVGSWGIEGVLGLAGCYLIVSAIVGKIIPIGKYIPEVSLQFRKQVILATFGCVLALPIMWSTYAKMITGTKGEVLSAPSIPEKIESTESHSYLTGDPLHLVNVSTAFAAAIVQAQAPCPVVESFGLDQETIRQLKSARFQGRVFVYVGDIHSLSRKPSMVHVIIADRESLPTSGRISESELDERLARIPQRYNITLAVRSQGASMSFEYAVQRYQLTVTQVYAVLIGSDKIAVEICQES